MTAQVSIAIETAHKCYRTIKVFCRVFMDRSLDCSAAAMMWRQWFKHVGLSASPAIDAARFYLRAVLLAETTFSVHFAACISSIH